MDVPSFVCQKYYNVLSFPMANFPTGSVAFLFTDIEDSARLWQEYPETMQTSLEQHHAILQEAIESHKGSVFQVIGDAFCAAFADASDAFSAALAAQRSLLSELWKETGPLRVRMGLHSGPAETRDGEYLSSLTLVRVQRIMSAGHGGQILLSPVIADLVRQQLPAEISLRDLGRQRLRGLIQLEHIFQVIAPDLPVQFPPLRVVESEAVIPDSSAELDSLVRGRLVARSSELQQLQHHWSRARQAHGHLVMLSGEPGIGKTRLAQELMTGARKDGAVVLNGGCYEYEAATSYLPFVEAIRAWVNKQSIENLKAHLGDTATELAKLAPEIESKLSALKPNPPLAPDEERLRLFDNVARFLHSLAASRGLLLFLDDLHWADRGTLSLLYYVLRHLRNDRALVLGAYRDVELNRLHPLAGILVDWNRERLLTRLPLHRFSREDTNTMLVTLFGEDTVSVDFVNLVFRETEGNPYFVEEVVKALIEQGDIYRSDGRWDRREINKITIPQSVKDAVGRRLNRLSDICEEVLTFAAGLGKQFLFYELLAAGSSGEDATLDALDEAAAAQLIVSTGDESFSFTHDKIREILIEDLNPIRRRRLHRRIGEGLEKLHAANPNPYAGDLSYHFTLSGDLQKSLKHSLRAAENASKMFGHDEALAFYKQARDAAEELGQMDLIAPIDESMGDVYNQRGETILAVEAYKRGLGGTTSPAKQASIKSRIGSVYGIVGDPRGLPFLEEAVDELDFESQKDDLAYATAFLGRYHHYHSRHSKAIEYLEQARSLAEPIGNPHTLQTIYGYLAGAYQHLAQLDKSDAWARKTITMSKVKNHLPAQAVGNEFLAENAYSRGDWDAALELTTRNHELADKIGALNRKAWSAYPRMQAFWGKGHLTEAYQTGQSALELCEQIADSRLASWIESTLVIVATDLGKDKAAEHHAQEGLRRGADLGQVALHSYSLHAAGYWHMRRLNWEDAKRCYQQSLEKWRPTENRVTTLLSLAYTAEALLGCGHIEESMELIDEAINLARLAQAPQLAALSGRVQAQALAELGQPERAAAAFETAIADLQRLGSRLELGRAHYHRAKMLHAGGDFKPARVDTECALDILTACGANRDIQRAKTLLIQIEQA